MEKKVEARRNFKLKLNPIVLYAVECVSSQMEPAIVVHVNLNTSELELINFTFWLLLLVRFFLNFTGLCCFLHSE